MTVRNVMHDIQHTHAQMFAVTSIRVAICPSMFHTQTNFRTYTTRLNTHGKCAMFDVRCAVMRMGELIFTHVFATFSQPHQCLTLPLELLEVNVRFFPLLLSRSSRFQRHSFVRNNIINTLSTDTHTHTSISGSTQCRGRLTVTDAGGKFVIKSSRRQRRRTSAGPQHEVLFVQVKFLRGVNTRTVRRPTDWPLLRKRRVVSVYHRPYNGRQSRCRRPAAVSCLCV